ncbi:hypothetical protein H632_c2714p0, partial [Helicosporidium sp. ATCC 50920]
FARQIMARPGNKLIAGCRQPEKAKELAALGSGVTVLRLDVTDAESIGSFAKSIKEMGAHADVVIHNAGTYQRQSFGEVTREGMLADFETNTIGPMLMIQALANEKVLGGTRGRSLVAILTSKMGSIADNGSGGSYSYRASKAAVNIVAKSLSIDLEPRGVVVTLLHPGFVKTDMTEGRGLIDAPTSVSGMLSVLESGKELGGQFIAWDDKPIPW